jgi:hypothetical protein
MNIFAMILLSIWQLPQHIIGIILLLSFTSKYIPKRGGGYYFAWDIMGCISLGEIIIMNCRNLPALWHERGHTVQSRILGPLYLLVIGLPSLLWALYWKYGKPTRSYYDFYTEKWANKIMGIKKKW